MANYYRRDNKDGTVTYIRQIGTMSFKWHDNGDGEPHWDLSDEDPFGIGFARYFHGPENVFIRQLEQERKKATGTD